MADQLYDALAGSRDKALSHGNYGAACREHENIIKTATKMLRTCSEEDAKKLEQLRDQVKSELNMMEDILAELSLIARGAAAGGRNDERPGSLANIADDPDIWPPPTADPSVNRGFAHVGNSKNSGAADNNLPAWARQREQRAPPATAQQLARRPVGGAAEPPRRTAGPVDEQQSATRLRSERDSASNNNNNNNRKR